MKILVSSGLGRLHLDKVASIFKMHTDYDVVFMTGAIPNKLIAIAFLRVFGQFIYGRKNIADRLHLRIPKGLKREDVISLYMPDIVMFIGLIFNKLHLVSIDRVYSSSYYLFGFLSSLHIKKYDALYVRAGAGNVVIKRAKKLGKYIIVDYSSAHPNDIYDSLIKSKSKYALNTFQERKKLWNAAIYDVIESDIVVVNSPYVMNSLVRNGIPKEKIYINNLPIEVGEIPCKTSYKLSNQINIGYSGRFVSWKGCDTLLSVIEELSHSYDNITLNIYGIVESHYYKDDLFVKLKQSKHIVEHGLLDQKHLFVRLREMDIYTFLSYSEGSAQSVKEAMAIGLPVVCTETSGAPVETNVNGIVCENDIKSCCSSMIYLLENYKQRLRLGSSARSEIKFNHNNTKFVSTIQAILNIDVR